MSEASYVCFWSKSYRKIFLNIFLLSRIINPSRFNLFVDSNLRDLISGHWQDDCMFLLCHVRVSGWIHNLYLPECQGTSYTSLAKWLSVRLRTKWLWVQVLLQWQWQHDIVWVSVVLKFYNEIPDLTNWQFLFTS